MKRVIEMSSTIMKCGSDGCDGILIPSKSGLTGYKHITNECPREYECNMCGKIVPVIRMRGL